MNDNIKAVIVGAVIAASCIALGFILAMYAIRKRNTVSANMQITGITKKNIPLHAKINKKEPSEELEIDSGIKIPYNDTIVVNDSKTWLDFRDRPLDTISITNDGNETVYVSYNDVEATSMTPLYPGGTLKLDDTKLIVMWCDSGKSSVVNLRGYYR